MLSQPHYLDVLIQLFVVKLPMLGVPALQSQLSLKRVFNFQSQFLCESVQVWPLQLPLLGALPKPSIHPLTSIEPPFPGALTLTFPIRELLPSLVVT